MLALLQGFFSREPAEQRVVLPITIDESGVNRLRRAVEAGCDESFAVFRIEPVPRRLNQVRVWLRLSKSGVGGAMSTAMRVLPRAEIGKVTPVDVR